MSDFITDWYAWIKALHVISVIAWMAGLLYLPRLFVYHAAAEPGSLQSETFKAMERRLYRGITTPALHHLEGLGAYCPGNERTGVAIQMVKPLREAEPFFSR